MTVRSKKSFQMSKRSGFERTAAPAPSVAQRPRRLQGHRSSFAFSADLTILFQIGLPALAAPFAVLCSSLVATKPLSRMISNTNRFSARLTTSRAITSSYVPTNQTRSQINLDRLQRLLVVLGSPQSKKEFISINRLPQNTAMFCFRPSFFHTQRQC